MEELRNLEKNIKKKEKNLTKFNKISINKYVKKTQNNGYLYLKELKTCNKETRTWLMTYRSKI